MNIHMIIGVLLWTPVWFILGDQEYLEKKNIFLKYLIISLSVLIFGSCYKYYSKHVDSNIVYIFSQESITFLLLYKLIRTPYYKIYKRIRNSDTS